MRGSPGGSYGDSFSATCMWAGSGTVKSSGRTGRPAFIRARSASQRPRFSQVLINEPVRLGDDRLVQPFADGFGQYADDLPLPAVFVSLEDDHRALASWLTSVVDHLKQHQNGGSAPGRRRPSRMCSIRSALSSGESAAHFSAVVSR